MAGNTGKGYRKGPVKDRYQEHVADGNYAKYDKRDNLKGYKEGPWKGVPKR